MASCAYCNTTILFGGRRRGELRFCNDKCQQQGALASVADQLPAADVAAFIRRVHQGNCPECSGPGPVDVHISYRVWSALLLTSWSSHPIVSCRSCGTKRKLGNTAFSLFFGWWGIPWGILMTPIQLARNIFSIIRPNDASVPSAALEKILRLQIASRVANASQQHDLGA